jgi:lipoprotein-releasing system ATP-binding protein
MTSLLSFENVSKRYPDGRSEIVVLDGASFEFQEGVFIGVWGARRAGKSTLLRLMAGIEQPDTGRVCFEGESIGAMSLSRRERLLHGEIALMASANWHPCSQETVVDHVALALGGACRSLREAKRRARIALDRVEIGARAHDLTDSLSLAERMRAMLARALVRKPRLLLVDEPALAPSLIEQDSLCGLLRALAVEDGATLVVASEEMTPLHGAEVVMSVGDGELCSTDEQGTIVRLPGGGAHAGRREP